MTRISNILLRVLQGILAGASAGLSAYVIDWYRARKSQPPPPSVEFLLVASILSLSSILYLELAPRFARRYAHARAILVVEGLNAVLYFAGFIAFAVFLGTLVFCKGRVCRVSRADAVLAAAAFCAWFASTISTAMQTMKVGAEARAKGEQMQMRDV